MLARDPRQGDRVGHTDTWGITTRPFVNRQEQVVELVVYYRFDEEYVTVLAVRQAIVD